MTQEFRPSSYQAEVPDLVKEYQKWDNDRTNIDVPTGPDPLALKMVREGRLNSQTGAVKGLSPKARTILMFQPSEQYKKNYDKIFTVLE
jgi:hypothetical protein